MKNIETNPKKIENFLSTGKDDNDNRVIFIVPEYQRPYSWTIQNCDKLWQDICNFMDNKTFHSYFLGTVILSCHDNDNKLELIDGQQRTTTFLLLLKALLIVVNNKLDEIKNCSAESSGLFSGLKERRKTLFKILYNVDVEYMSEIPDISKDSEIYKNVNILQNNSNNEIQFKNDLNSILSSNSFDDAQQKVVQIKYKKQDNRFSNFFKNFKFFYNKFESMDSAKINEIAKVILNQCEIIEIKSWNVEQAITMFNSLNSDGLPLSDADILSAKLFATSKSKNESEVFSKKWNDLLLEVDALSSKGILNIDSILAQYMYIARAKNGEVVSSTGSVNVTVPGVRRYFVVENKDLINEPLITCSNMFMLSRIWNKVTTNNAIISLLLKFNENAKFFLACFFSRFFDSEGFEEKINNHIEEINLLAKTMLRLFTILELEDIGYSSSKFKTFLFKESAKLVDKNVDIKEIVNDFNAHINNEFDVAKIQRFIIDYDKNLIVVLNEYVFAMNNNLEFSLDEKYDIEHIMPSSGHNIAEIQKDAGIIDRYEFDELVNKVGNKILLEQKINRSISNDWFRTKVQKYKNSKYPLAKEISKTYENVEKPIWNKECIENATKEAQDRLIAFIFNQK